MWKVRLFLLLAIVLVVLAFKFLPWYVLVGLVVLFVFSLKFLGKWFFVWLISLPFRAKGSVLRKAKAEVHSLEPAAAPVPKSEDTQVEEEDEEGMGSPALRLYYRLEVTITPRPKTGGFTHWEMGELCLVRPDQNVMDGGDDSCQIKELEIEENGKFTADDGFKVPGPHRLRLLIAVKPGTRRLVFQYYFEKFGEVTLPEVVAGTATPVGPGDRLPGPVQKDG